MVKLVGGGSVVCLFVCLFSTSYINQPDGQASLFTVEGSTILQYYSIWRDVELVVMPVSCQGGVQAQGGVRPREGGVQAQGVSGPAHTISRTILHCQT